MTVIVESDPGRADQLHAALADATVLSSIEQLGHHLDAHPRETVVVLGPDVEMSEAISLAHAHRLARPALGVVVLRTRVDSPTLAEAMRAGIREVVDAGDLTEVGEAVRRTTMLGEELLGEISPPTDAAGTGKLLTVFSTKGGVGKTTIATNVAVAMANGGQRVCIVDLDVESGDVAVMLHLFPTLTLANLRDLRGAIDTENVQSLVTQHESGLAVVAAPVGADSREQLSADEVGRVLGCLKKLYDVVIVDTSGSFDDFALHAFDVTDLLILVATLDIPALRNLKVAVGTLDLLNQDRSGWRLVLNRADSRVGLSVSEFQETIGLEIAAVLPTSRDVLSCVNKGQTIVAAMPRHKLSKTIRGLAESARTELAGGADAVPEGASRRPGRRRLEVSE